jgi:hypothetical protein
MTGLTDDDQRFLRQRARRNRVGRIALPVALIVWLLFWIWLVVQVPLLANPAHVIERLQRNEIAPGTTVTMASLLPVVVSILSGGFIVLLLFAWGWARLERRYLQIAQHAQMREPPSATPPPPAAVTAAGGPRTSA